MSALRTILLAAAAAAPSLAQTRMFTLEGQVRDGTLGGAVAPAGDVDGDGFGDVLAGAPLASSAGPHAGWAAVYSGRTGATLHVLPGRAPWQFFGAGLGPVGDLDGDRHDDFAVGAPGDGTNGTRAGRVYVFSGRTGRLLFDLLGDGPGDLLGHAIAPAGDVDADGVVDFIVGAPENGDPVPNYGPGYAKVFSGRTGSVLHVFVGRQVAFEQGHAVAGAGDVDHDGHGDLIVAAVLDGDTPVGVGAVRVYSGRTGAVLYTFRGGRNTDHFGVSAAGVGDVDADGTPDIGAGCVELTTGRPGHVSIFSGATGQRVQYVVASAASDMFGVAMAGVGDLDRDGHDDFAVGAPGVGGGFGAVLVYRGRDGSLLRRIEGEDLGAAFAFPFAAGDVNADGFADLLVGARGVAQNRGAVKVFSGVNTTTVGAGCGDHAPAPSLVATTPRIGQPWTHLLDHAAPFAVAVLVASPTPTAPLPLGASGCTLYVGLGLLSLGAVRADGSGRALHRLPIPADRGLVGQALTTQIALAARTRPVALTNGVVAAVEN